MRVEGAGRIRLVRSTRSALFRHCFNRSCILPCEELRVTLQCDMTDLLAPSKCDMQARHATQTRPAPLARTRRSLFPANNLQAPETLIKVKGGGVYDPERTLFVLRPAPVEMRVGNPIDSRVLHTSGGRSPGAMKDWLSNFGKERYVERTYKDRVPLPTRQAEWPKI